MNYVDEMISIAAARWKETETDAERISSVALAAQKERDWKVASIYMHRCYEGYEAYTAVIWRLAGYQGTYALIQTKGVLLQWDEDRQNYVIIASERLS